VGNTEVDVTPGAVTAADRVSPKPATQAADTFEWTDGNTMIVVSRDPATRCSIDFRLASTVDSAGRPTPVGTISVSFEPPLASNSQPSRKRKRLTGD
jgi:hypothetical protein